MEANSEAKVFKRSRKRKQFFQNQALPNFQPGYNRRVKCYNNNNNIESTTRARYGIENGMERNENLAMDYGRCQNGMEDFTNEMEDNLPYFYTNSILDFALCIYRKIHTDVGW